MKDFLSVREFSRLTGIEVSTLHYWDEIGLFSPIKRNPSTNYRYYSPEQLITVNFISVLSSLQIPLKTIGVMKSERNPENIVSLIAEQERKLDLELRRLHDCYSIVHTRSELIRLGMQADPSGIMITELRDTAMVVGERNEWKEDESFYGNFMQFCKTAKTLRIELGYPIGGSHESFDRFLAAPGKPDNFFSLDPTGGVIRKAGTYLVAHAVGYYGELENLRDRVADYAKQHSLTLTGPVYIVYLLDEVCVTEPDKYLAQMSVAVAEPG